jgi:RNA polymerase primary sigma factor
LQALAEQSRIVRLPLNQVGSLSKMNKVSSRLEQRFERPPSADEIATEMEISQNKVEETLRISTRTISMDAPLDQDDDLRFLDVFVSEDAPGTDEDLIRESLAREIQRSLSTLAEKEREIINLFYGIGVPHNYTLEEIGDMFDLTRERVRQIKEKALRRLKHSSRSKLLKAYLG